jgi:hypothetical protein
MKPAEADCYRLIQQIALQQDPVCFICQDHESQAGHHLFKRDRLATAFLSEAVRGVCNDCHRWAENNPALERTFMVEAMGPRYFELERLSWQVVRHFDFVGMRKELREKLIYEE